MIQMVVPNEWRRRCYRRRGIADVLTSSLENKEKRRCMLTRFDQNLAIRENVNSQVFRTPDDIDAETLCL